MLSKITIVSCFYIIKNKHEQVDYDKWIYNFMQLKRNKCIYCNKESYEYLYKNYPEQLNMKYIIKEIDEFYVSKYNWKKDELLDHEILIGHNELLYKIWNEKIFFVMDVINNNYFDSELYAWIDIGYFRDKIIKPFPITNKLNINKINMLLVKEFSLLEQNNIQTIDSRFKYTNHISASVFIGNKTILTQYEKLYSAMIDEFENNKVFKGKDQSLINFIALQNKEIFNLIYAQQKWTYLQEYLI